jgi:hypothetical protein
MRTDARDVPASRARVDDLRENDVLLLVSGRGVSFHGKQLVVEDRHFWLSGLIPLFNTDARDELAVLVNATGAVRDMQIGEGQTLIDVLAALVLPNFVPLVGYVLPSYTFHAHGTPIRLDNAAHPTVESASEDDMRPIDDATLDDDAPATRAPSIDLRGEDEPVPSAPVREQAPPVDEARSPPLLDEPHDPSDEGSAP